MTLVEEKNEPKTESDLSKWLSTYGLLTSKRILERFNITLSDEELITVIKDPHNVYHHLLIVPLKNVFNGIILQQAHDYQVYAQKLFVDYLLSGESGKPEDAPGAGTREALEQERLKLAELGESFNKEEIAHQHLIAESQANLITAATSLQKVTLSSAKKMRLELSAQDKEEELIKRAIRSSLTYYSNKDADQLMDNTEFWVKLGQVLGMNMDEQWQARLLDSAEMLKEPIEKIENIVSTYSEKVKNQTINIRYYRTEFYNLILRVTESLNLLPDYRIDVNKVEENRSSLHFDSHIGDEDA